MDRETDAAAANEKQPALPGPAGRPPGSIAAKGVGFKKMPVRRPPAPGPVPQKLVPARSAAPAAKPPKPAHPPAPQDVKHAPPPFLSVRYKPIHLISHGGRGTVYKAYDKLLEIFVALKFLPELASSDPEIVRAFKREASVAMSLSHENIMKVHNLEMEHGRMFLVMEFVEGQNFREILQQLGRLTLQSVLSVAEACVEPLEYAHRRGVAHHDLKPDNLMRTQEGVLKIVDLGLARHVHMKPSDTDKEFLEGTPGYMSPEQVQGAPLDARSDVYALGVLLSELLTGMPPFSPDAAVERLLSVEPPPLPNVPVPVAQVLHKALARAREDRWQSIAAFYAALARAAEPADKAPPSRAS